MENFNMELFANDLESKVGLTLVGGRPGVGKTTFLLNVTAQMLRRNKNVFFVSLELDEKSVKNYLLSTGLNDQDSLSKLTIYDQTNFNIDDLSADETVVNFDLIIIDYLNLIGYANDKSLDYIVKQLKNISNHKNINIIASAQLSKGNDESRIPTESDFMISKDIFSKYVDNSILLYEK
jgi:predicted ATP-dependent serine protease